MENVAENELNFLPLIYDIIKRFMFWFDTLSWYSESAVFIFIIYWIEKHQVRK